MMISGPSWSDIGHEVMEASVWCWRDLDTYIRSMCVWMDRSVFRQVNSLVFGCVICQISSVCSASVLVCSVVGPLVPFLP
jgi:hypothetical protein